MIGVAAFVYGTLHFSAYVVQQHFDLSKVASEIYLRFYLAIGLMRAADIAGAGRHLHRRDDPPDGFAQLDAAASP